MPNEQPRPRVLVSTDIGGTDPDDFQSMVHLLLYADVLDIEGLLSSPYGDGRVEDIHAVIDCYERDLPNLLSHEPGYPAADRLREVTKQGALAVADHEGRTDTTEGSDWIVRCARRDDDRLLEVLVWGGLDDVAQALHDAPDIAERVRVHCIGGPNTMWSVEAYRYLEHHHPSLRMIESNSTYRGFFEGPPESPGPDNRAFVAEHAAGHGALGDFFAAQLPHLKMGDSPTVTWLLDGPRDPAQPSWGGRFVPAWEGRGATFERLTTEADAVEVNTVIEIVLPLPPGFGSGDTARLLVDERQQGPFAPGVVDGDRVRFRFSVYHARRIPYRVESSHPDLDGLEGAVTTRNPSPTAAAHRSSRHPRWWTDDPDPAAAIGRWPGARWVGERRGEFLSDFAARLDRCLAPAR